MNIPAMVAKYDLKPRGVIQVGSHHGEEITLWNSMGIHQVHFEPVISNYKKLLADFPDAVVWPVAASNRNGVGKMFCETVNGGQSCSLLEPKKHLEILPWIKFDSEQKVLVMQLDAFGFGPEFNFMHIDAQGSEGLVLQGARETLRKIDFLFIEVNRAEVFYRCWQIEDMDDFLGSSGFQRVETEWHGGDFGDALYVRR